MAPAASEGAEKAVWGPAVLPNGASAFPTYEHLGVDTLQLTLDWASIAPTRPADPRDPADPSYRWPADVDRAAREAPRHGIRTALLAIRSPSWANGGRSAEWAPNPGDYAAFLVAAARRYAANRRWMIWTEPNKTANFKPTGDPAAPRTYALLLDAAYRALKGVSRRNKVIGGMTWSAGEVRPAQFLSQMRLPDGRPPRLDWFGHNPFPFGFPRISKPPLRGGFRDISDLDTYAREIKRAYRRDVPFWLSEFTVQSDRSSDTFAGFVSRESQARWLTAAYRIADRHGPVAGIGWLSLLDEPPRPGSELWGLLTSSLQRKPAYFAYRRAPSERHQPRVETQRVVRAGTLRGRGLGVRVRPRTTGRITVELRHRGRRLVRARTDGRRRASTVRIRRPRNVRRGTYQLVVRSPRGATLTRALRVR